MAESSAAGQAERGAIRVFVSSTFRDMAAEREELVKVVFPQLRKGALVLKSMLMSAA